MHLSIATKSRYLNVFLQCTQFQHWRKGDLPGSRDGEVVRARRSPPTNVSGLGSPIRCFMWAEFVGSLPCSERFFSGYSEFPLSPKTNISRIRPHKLTALKLLPCINKVSLPFFTDCRDPCDDCCYSDTWVVVALLHILERSTFKKTER